MSRSTTWDYAFLAKAGFALGIGLFIIGAGGEFLTHTILHTTPDWADTVFFDLEFFGIAIGFVSPFVFGIFLPLLNT